MNAERDEADIRGMMADIGARAKAAAQELANVSQERK